MTFLDMNTLPEIEGVTMPKSKLGFLRIIQICRAAEHLFVTKGFFDTSISDICHQAKIAVGTFYIYFKDKAAPYRYLVHNYRISISKYLQKHIACCDTRYQMEHEGIKAFIRFGWENPQCYNIVWGCLYIDYNLFKEYYVSFAMSYAKALQKYSDELVEVDYLTASYVLMGISNFVGLQAIFSGQLTDAELEKRVSDVMTILKTGLFKSQI